MSVIECETESGSKSNSPKKLRSKQRMHSQASKMISGHLPKSRVGVAVLLVVLSVGTTGIGAKAAMSKQQSLGQFALPKGGEDITDQRRAQTVWKLTIMFFIAAKMRDGQPNSRRTIPALRAFRRPPLRSGLLYARRAGSVRICSQRSSPKTPATVDIGLLQNETLSGR
jgi:hypothetical protein